MNFDYFTCFQHKVIVTTESFVDHVKCDILGEFFVIKTPAKKLDKGLIARDLVEKAQEKINIERYDKRRAIEKKRKILAQERYEKQLGNDEVIINLEAIEI